VDAHAGRGPIRSPNTAIALGEGAINGSIAGVLRQRAQAVRLAPAR